MIFYGISGQTVEINIINYQFPDEIDDRYDKNWLNIYLKVKSNFGNWRTIDPSLTTWEVKELIDWFITLSKDMEPEYFKLNFIEPNLSFELLDNSNKSVKMFRINFNLESRPQSAINDKEYFVDCLADNQELNRIVTELKIELNKYPEGTVLPPQGAAL
jgi:hypothetical protein